MPPKRRWRTQDLPPLGGVKDVCERLGVQKMTFQRWRESGYFDVPAADPGPAQGPVWDLRDVDEWKTENGRQRAPAGTAAD